MQRIDESPDANKYKVIIGNKEINIETSKFETYSSKGKIC